MDGAGEDTDRQLIELEQLYTDEHLRTGTDSTAGTAGTASTTSTTSTSGTAGTLRADAARNRERVLAAAEKVFADRAARHVTMDDIARAAGVGRATLYRRFPTPSAVALALLDEHERQLQERILRGDPPLGPGAPPAERLAAFYAAMTDLLERHLHLALGAETGQARFTTGAYRFWRLHTRILLAHSPLGDANTLADITLAPLAPELYHHQRHELGRSQEQIIASLQVLARRLLGGDQHAVAPSTR